MRNALLSRKEFVACTNPYALDAPMLQAIQAVLLNGLAVAQAAQDNEVPANDLLELSRKIERDFLVELTRKNQFGVESPLMNMGQFECIAKLIRSKEPARNAAMMVLVLGWSAQATVRATGLKTQSVWNTCQRFRVAYARLIKVFPEPVNKSNAGEDPILLTPEQFNAVSFFIRSREPASSAAKLVLVYEQGKAHAAREAGIQLQSCWNTIERFKTAIKLIQSHFPGSP